MVGDGGGWWLICTTLMASNVLWLVDTLAFLALLELFLGGVSVSGMVVGTRNGTGGHLALAATVPVQRVSQR
jgi:hypothetical protein